MMRYSGTDFTTGRGWPEPSDFHYLSESGVRTRGRYRGPVLVLRSMLRSLRR